MLAYINDGGSFTADGVTVTATDTSVMVNFTGAFARVGSTNPKSTTNVALAGSYSEVHLTGDTQAFIENAELTVLGPVDVEATRNNYIGTFAGDLALSQSLTANNSIAVAGSVSINIFSGTTEAYLFDVHGTLAGDLTVKAKDDSILVAIAGAVGVGSKAGVGIAVGYNSVSHTITSYLQDTLLIVGSNVDVETDDSASIGSLGLAGGGSTSSSGGAGAGNVSINVLHDTLDAHVSQSSSVIANGSVTVSATDNSVIASLSGALAIAVSGQGAVGAAISYDLITNTVEAYIDSSTVRANNGTFTVSATSTPVLVALAAGGAGADGFALGGSLSINSIADTVETYINNSTVSSSGNMSVTSSESATMVVVAGGVGVAAPSSKAGPVTSGGKGPNGGSAVGAAIAYNYIGGDFDPANPDHVDNTTNVGASNLAYINNSTVTVGGNLTVSAGLTPPSTTPNTSTVNFDGGTDNSLSFSVPVSINSQLVSIALAGSGANDFALGGSLTLSFIRETIHAYISNSLNVTAVGSVTVSAIDDSSIGTGAGAVAVSLEGTSVGAAVASNNIANDLKSYIENSTVTSQSNSISVISQESATITVVAVAGAGSPGQDVTVAGSIVVNGIDNGIDAHIAVGSNVTGKSGVLVSSSDSSTINAGAGQVSIAIGEGSDAFGVANIDSVISNTTRAYIDSSTVTATTGSVQVLANSNLTITTVAAGGQGSREISAGGAVVVNVITDTTDAQVTGGSTVTSAIGLAVQAQDSSTIGTGAGQVSIAISNEGGAGAVGAAIAVNTISNTVKAYIDGSTITTGGFGFNPSTAVDTSANTIDLGANYGLQAGEPVVYNAGPGGTAIGGLTSGQTYYVIPVANSTKVKLASSAANAQAGTAIPLTSVGGGIHHNLTPTIAGLVFNPANAVDTTANTIDLGANYNLHTGEAVTYNPGAVVAPIGGLTAGTTYYVIPVTNTSKIQLATSAANAQAGIAIPLTSVGFTLNLSGGVNASGNTIDLGASYGLVTGQQVVYNVGSGGTAIGGLTNGTTYYVIAIPNSSKVRLATSLTNAQIGTAIALTSLGVGASQSLTLIEPHFNTSSAVDTSANTIDLGLNYGLTTGESVTYAPGSGNTAIGGLTSGTTYYVIAIGGSTKVMLASSLSNAQNGTVIDLTSTGSGTQSLTVNAPQFASTPQFNGASSVAAGGNTIDLGANYGLKTGQTVTYSAGAGNTIIGGLINGQVYYVIAFTGSTKVQLADTLAHAQAGIPVALTTGGVGNNQTLFATGPGFDGVNAVDTSGNTIDLGIDYGLVTGEPIVYNAGSNNTAVGNLVSGTTYYVILGPSSTKIKLATSFANALAGTTISLTSAGTGFQTFTVGKPTFDGSASVDSTANTIDLGAYYGLQTGQGITYNAGSGTPIGGLISGETYYVILVPGTTKIKLATTVANALARTAMTLDAQNLSFDAGATAVDMTASTIDLGANYGLFAGEPVTYSSGGGSSAIGGLSSGATYYAIPVSGTTKVKLATSPANAQSDTAIAFTSTGAGTESLAVATP